MNIVLIGYRGTGKSTQAGRLQQSLDLEAVSIDEEIVKQEGITIPQIVKQHGWEYFRNLEKKVVEYVSQKENIIIDCGGGIVLKSENIFNLKKKGKIILLTLSPEAIKERIYDDENRPALKGKSAIEEINEVLEERREMYNAAADYVIDTTDKNIDEVTKEILSWLENERD